jgi:Na+/melibiose symporter-like transporter
MPEITKTEIEGLRVRSITSWKRVAIATFIAVFLGYVSGTLSGAHFHWWAFSAVMGMLGVIAFLFAILSIVMTMYYEHEARQRYDTSWFCRTQFPIDRFIMTDVLKV